MEITIIPQSPGFAKMRRWPRFSVELPVRIYCWLPPAVHEGTGNALNGGGMAVRTTADLHVGDQVSVEFTPPSAQQPVTARSFVRNCNDAHTYGIEFIAESDHDYSTIGQIEYELRRLASTLQPSA